MLKEFTMKKSIYLLIVVMCSGFLFSQPATLVFKTTEAVDVSIYKPIDNTYNQHVISDILHLKPNSECLYSVEVDEFSSVHIRYSDDTEQDLLLVAGDTLQTNYSKQGISFYRGNGNGQSFLERSHSGIFHQIDSIVNVHWKHGVQNNTNAITDDIHKSVIAVLSDSINYLIGNNYIKPKYGHILMRQLQYEVYANMIINCKVQLYKRMAQLSASDSLIIAHYIDSIAQFIPLNDSTLLRYKYADYILANLYNSKYNALTDLEKQELWNGYSEVSFGNFAFWLVAPDYIKIPMFCSLFIDEVEFKTGNCNIDVIYDYLMHLNNKELYAYIKLVEQKHKDYILQKILQVPLFQSAKLIDDQIDSFDQLIRYPKFRGKKLFIDIWATWCSPCKREMRYASKMDSLAKLYNVSLIYMSVDDKENRYKWETTINQLELSGYHLLANEKLEQDIIKRIFKNDNIAIPRYVFIDETGKIVTADAPRPSSYTEIEKLFKQ